MNNSKPLLQPSYYKKTHRRVSELIIHITKHEHLKNFLIAGSEMYNIKRVE